MVIMEYAPHGALLPFLRGKREIYDAIWTKTTNDPEKEFTLVDLVVIGFQVNRGMAFLASKKVINVYLDSEQGLTKLMMNEDEVPNSPYASLCQTR